MEHPTTEQLARQDGLSSSMDTETSLSDATGSPEATRRTGGRRYRAGRPTPDQLSAFDQQPAEPTPFRDGMPARGALAGLLMWCLVSCLVAAWLHLVVVAALGFCAGSALAVRYSRPAALLRVVIAVPVVFAAAEILAQLATVPSAARQGLARPVTEGTLLTLAAVAPWLFGGTAGAVIIALFRGLPQCVADLRAELGGRTRAPSARRDRPVG